MLRVVPVGRELLDLPLLLGNPVIERALGILKKAHPSLISKLFLREAPLIVFAKETGRRIADMMEERVIERGHRKARGWTC